MRFNRRKFLIISGLTAFGLGSLTNLLKSRFSKNAHAQTAPAPQLATPVVQAKQPLLRFVAVADAGSSDRNQYDVGDAMSRYHQQNPYALVVFAGDNIYNHGEISKIKTAFEQPYQALLRQGVKFRACLGNHDIITDNGDPQVQYAGYNMKGRYYTYREQNVQFFALDTNGNADWKAQIAWLEQELSRSEAPWKVVYGHHPIYSSGRYGTNAAFVELFTPLFKKYGVQLYINGHEHDYERTRSINGTTYLITGIGGAAIRPVGKSEWTAYSASRYGFSAIEVFSDRLEISGIGTDSKVFDHGVVPIKST